MAAGLIASGIGLGLNLYGQYRQGKMARAIGKRNRQQYEQVAKNVVASGQRASLEERRKAELLASRAIAVAAAGGGSTDDPSISKIIADIEGEGAYRSAVAMYDAEEQEKKLKFEGMMAEFQGEEAEKASKLRMLGTVLGQGGSMYANYKGGRYG